MKLILCLDDNNGICFNDRRQSRDEEVVKRIIKLSENKDIYISKYSSSLLGNESKGFIVINNIEECKNDGYLFLENEKFNPSICFDEIIIFKWNRSYPYDFSIDVDRL